MKIIAKPPRKELVQWWIFFYPFLSCVVTIPFSLLIGYLQIRYTGKPFLLWEVPIIAIIGAIIGCLVFLHILNRFYWQLTEDRLISGVAWKKTYSLRNLDRIIKGIPVQQTWWLSQLKQEPILAGYQRSLVLRFVDGTLLPLYLHRFDNGTHLMTVLVNRYQDCVDSSYEFTPQELRCLKGCELNLEKRPKQKRSEGDTTG